MRWGLGEKFGVVFSFAVVVTATESLSITGGVAETEDDNYTPLIIIIIYHYAYGARGYEAAN